MGLSGVSAPGVSQAYLFAMGTLLFGLPLLAAYSNVDPGFFFGALVPYLSVSLVLAFLFLVRPIGRGRSVRIHRVDLISHGPEDGYGRSDES